MTYLWQEERGFKYYRVQTDQELIADKLKRRKRFQLAMYATNANLWVFTCTFARPDIAKKTLKSVTRQNPQIDSEGLIFYKQSNGMDVENIEAHKRKKHLKPTLSGSENTELDCESDLQNKEKKERPLRSLLL